jgi:anthranilate/para-aminobenzoate synthase component II
MSQGYIVMSGLTNEQWGNEKESVAHLTASPLPTVAEAFHEGNAVVSMLHRHSTSTPLFFVCFSIQLLVV